MSKPSPIEILRIWIENEGFPNWNLEDGMTLGTYGLVFFLNSKHQNSHPQGIALKTLNPEALPEKPTQLHELQREFSKWLRLPPHGNVLGAYRFRFATVPLSDGFDSESQHWIQIPVMEMERMEGTLGDWIGSDEIPLPARLSALAQAFNGLAHLYANGIQGHGDLKPSNILFKDISRSHEISHGSWLSDMPWMIKIADLGWADAWVDYGFTNKALREYIAPERLGYSPKVIPEKSDIFSMGIIAAELLSGSHPSSNLKRAKQSEGEWLKRAMRGDWDLAGLPSDRLRDFVRQCLDPAPEARPTAREAVHVLCQELMGIAGVDIEPTLELWSNQRTQDYFPFISERSEEMDRLMRTRGLGNDVEANTMRRLRLILESIAPHDIYSLEDWLQAASGMLVFLEGDESPLNQVEASRIRIKARMHLENTLGNADSEDFDALTAGIDEKDTVTPFERFGHLVGHLATMAKVDFEQCLKGEWNLSPLALAGFAHHRASRARMESNPPRTPIGYLDIAVENAPAQAAPYFFRALRRHEVLILSKIRESAPTNFTIQDVIEDLEKACSLAPCWVEPASELKKVSEMP